MIYPPQVFEEHGILFYLTEIEVRIDLLAWWLVDQGMITDRNGVWHVTDSGADATAVLDILAGVPIAWWDEAAAYLAFCVRDYIANAAFYLPMTEVARWGASTFLAYRIAAGLKGYIVSPEPFVNHSPPTGGVPETLLTARTEGAA